jgi:hypothetical protein
MLSVDVSCHDTNLHFQDGFWVDGTMRWTFSFQIVLDLDHIGWNHRLYGVVLRPASAASMTASAGRRER